MPDLDRFGLARGLRGMAAVLLLALVLAGFVAAEADASPYIQAHRGGTVVNGVPTYPENSIPAFRASAKRGFVLEFDVKLTSDGVPVVFHDGSLDRATDCEGALSGTTRAQLAACRIDILGTEAKFRRLGPRDPRRARVPTLSRVLRFLERTGASASIELANNPGQEGFDPTAAPAEVAARAIERSDVPRSRLILQSFYPPNLRAAAAILPDVDQSFLTLAQANDAGPSIADSLDAAWLSPNWPVGAQVIAEAHSLGQQVVPYTIDSRSGIAAATSLGADALITNDPTLARRVVRRETATRRRIPPPPSRRRCRALAASRTAPVSFSRAPDPRAPRVFAMQFKQDVANVRSYRSFRAKIECSIRRYVVPRMATGRPNVVAFNEDVGLMTIATGSRGAPARELVADPENGPSCEQQGVPCGALAALNSIGAAYSSQVLAYRARFPALGTLEQNFVAPTDTFARGWMQTFSDMARRYDLYILGSNNQAPFRESRDPSEIAAFSDPDQPEPDSVYVATDDRVFNEVFMWGPRTVSREGPVPLRNVVARNRKVPLTELEEQLEISPGASTGPDAIENVRPYRLPGTPARLSFATSLPAFVFGHELGEPPPRVDPCSDTSLYYMRCLDALGTNVVIQDEANPGRWAGLGGDATWQPLEWMRSTWRHVADPSVGFDYNVTPFMTGNLADIIFDGQTAITQRAPTRGRCSFIGNRRFMPGEPEADGERFRRYAGPKRRFLAIAPWVARSRDRDRLRAVSARLAPGSGSRIENDYVETAVVADLPFPVERGRPGCLGPRD